jgi:hypothetical protein
MALNIIILDIFVIASYAYLTGKKTEPMEFK